MSSRTARRLTLLLPGLLAVAGCQPQMTHQPKYKTLAVSRFFDDGAAARPLVEGTIAQGTATPPRPPVTLALVRRGRERYEIYCSVCHGRDGGGGGIVPSRGFTQPPSYHSARLREAPDSHFFDVITHGLGAMYSYDDRLASDDRWAVIAYIRALQLSQRVSAAELTAAERERLGGP